MNSKTAKAKTTETRKKVQPDKFTTQQVIDALTATKGMRTKAAKKLGCAYNTIVRYIKEYPEVAESEKLARETMLDAIELKAYAQAIKGDPTMMIFMLKTQGKERGYVEQQKLLIEMNLVNRAVEALKAAGKNPTELFEKIIQRAESGVLND